jgi:hypothetical protein
MYPSSLSLPHTAPHKDDPAGPRIFQARLTEFRQWNSCEAKSVTLTLLPDSQPLDRQKPQRYEHHVPTMRSRLELMRRCHGRSNRVMIQNTSKMTKSTLLVSTTVVYFIAAQTNAADYIHKYNCTDVKGTAGWPVAMSAISILETIHNEKLSGLTVKHIYQDGHSEDVRQMYPGRWKVWGSNEHIANFYGTNGSSPGRGELKRINHGTTMTFVETGVGSSRIGPYHLSARCHRSDDK